MDEPGLIDHLLAFLLGILIPLQSLLQGDSVMSDEGEITSREKLAIYKINSFSQWALTIFVLAIWWFKDRSFASLGLHWPDWTFSTSVLLLSLSFVVSFVYDIFQQIKSPENLQEARDDWKLHTPFMPTNGVEFRHFMVVVFTAAICEEILFRGFLINYLVSIFEPTWVGMVWAVMLPAVVFALSHLYQGWESVIKIAVLSVVFGSLFVLTGSLLIPVILHFFVNLISAWLSVRYMGGQDLEGEDEK